MFLEGATPNTAPAEVDAWIAHLRAIAPDSAEIYTLDRAPDFGGLRPGARATRETGVPVRVS